MIAALSQVCSLNSPFEKDLEDYSAGQCPAIEFWITKLEQYLRTHSVQQVRELLERYEIQAPVAAYQGGLFGQQVDARQEAWQLLLKRLDLCRSLQIRTLVVACDLAAPFSQADLERTRSVLRSSAEEAGRRSVRLALEFQARAAFGNNLQTAASLVSELGSPHLGLCLDAFHYYVGPSKPEDLAYLTGDNVFHVQLSDLAGIPRELAADGDRILPGDGDIPLAQLVDQLKSIAYEGVVAVELMNPQIWQVPALQFGEIAMTALRKVLGQASMGQ